MQTDTYGYGARGSTLWGKGANDGSRKSTTWGRRGGSSVVAATVGALALLVPVSTAAADTDSGTYVAPGLLAKADKSPTKTVHVIVQSTGGTATAESAAKGVGSLLRKRLDLVGGVAADLPAGQIKTLAKTAGLTITSDALVQVSGSTVYTSNEIWPYESGVASLWPSTVQSTTQGPAIAIVDSGVDAKRADFGTRVLTQVNLSSLTPTATGDGRGHGTFVAGIAAGSALGYAGAGPNAKLVSLDVMDDTGTARTSDVIAACDWILANRATYNIRVANFSLHSGAKNHFYNDPLDRAVEKLWFNGVFVVAASGNYGSSSGPSGVLYAPGNDPFVMTVGAVGLGTSIWKSDDVAAPWSAWGRTEDGFAKPELGAPGRYMVGPVPTGSTLVSERPDHVVSPGYMELSGTSFAAPVVAGSAAQILARHPTWTPDQVKGALMLSAKVLPSAVRGSVGVGGLNAYGAAMPVANPPHPNLALRKFVTSSGSGGDLSFDAASWATTVQADASWATASWADASWADASWAAASWADTSQEDGAGGEGVGVPPGSSPTAISDLMGAAG